MSTEEFAQRTQIHLRHYKEIPAFEEKAVGNQCVKMGVPPDIVSKRLNRYDNSRDTVFLSKRYPEETAQALGGAMAEFTQQFAIIQKKTFAGSSE